MAARRRILALAPALETKPLSVAIRVSPQELSRAFLSWAPPPASYLSYFYFVSGPEPVAASEGDNGGREVKQTKGMTRATMKEGEAALLVVV